MHRATSEQLPFADDGFDATLAQLVVHFMADPIAGIAEMARVTRPGGIVAACVWGFLIEPTDALPSMLEMASSSIRTFRNPSANRWSIRVLRPKTRWRAESVKHLERFDDFEAAIERAEELVEMLGNGDRPWRRLGH